MVVVKDLIAMLQKLPPMLPVALSSDEEGNNVRLIHGAGMQFVSKIEPQYMETLHPDDIDEDTTWFKIAEIW